MKRSELQQLISECIAEVLAEDKKTLAINEIKRIIAENKLSEADLAEIDFGKLVKRGADIFKQTTGISSEEDKIAAEKSLESAIKDYGKPISKEQRDELMRRAKTYSYLGKFEVFTDSKGKKNIAFKGESAAPKTINPNPTGAK